MFRILRNALTFITGAHSKCYTTLHTGLAQLVEHWSPKPGVVSSSLSTRAKKLKINSEKYKTHYNGKLY